MNTHRDIEICDLLFPLKVHLEMSPLTVYHLVYAVIPCCDWDPDPACIVERDKDVDNFLFFFILLEITSSFQALGTWVGCRFFFFYPGEVNCRLNWEGFTGLWWLSHINVVIFFQILLVTKDHNYNNTITEGHKDNVSCRFWLKIALINSNRYTGRAVWRTGETFQHINVGLSVRNVS